MQNSPEIHCQKLGTRQTQKQGKSKSTKEFANYFKIILSVFVLNFVIIKTKFLNCQVNLFAENPIKINF